MHAFKSIFRQPSQVIYKGCPQFLFSSVISSIPPDSIIASPVMTHKLGSLIPATLLSSRRIAISGLEVHIMCHQLMWHLLSKNIPGSLQSLHVQETNVLYVPKPQLGFLFGFPISINANTLLIAAYAENACTQSLFLPHVSILDFSLSSLPLLPYFRPYLLPHLFVSFLKGFLASSSFPFQPNLHITAILTRSRQATLHLSLA